MGGATGTDICVTRHNAGGSLDTSFDSDGRATAAIAPATGNDSAFAMALSANGSIVVSGQCAMGGATGNDACLARFNPDGSLDTSFDGDGVVVTAISPLTGSDIARSLAVLPDGKIVTTGSCQMGGATGQDFCLSRYNANGSPDVGFDSDGHVTTPIAPAAATDSGFSLAVQPDGRLVSAGQCNMGGATGTDMCLTRHNPDGSLDTTFNNDGIVTTAVAPATAIDVAQQVIVHTDGRVLTTGSCVMAGSSYDLCLTQYSSGGLVDQYDDAGSDDWDTAGSSIGLFGACLQATTLGTPTWTVNATCPTDDGTFWRAIPTTSSAIAIANPLTSTATATLRFGIRVADDYPTGDYVAPITFSVSAP
jgi:uncharacterized delta-60 repeat protein